MNNLVMLTGNVGQEPELKMLNGGRAMMKLRVATSDPPREGREGRTDWHSITAWGKTAERLSGLVGKGSRVVVTGKLRSGSYEKDGRKVTTVEVEAMTVEVVTARERTGVTPPPPAVAATPSGFTDGYDEDDSIPF